MALELVSGPGVREPASAPPAPFRKVLVTPSESLTGETTQLQEPAFFVDWLSISQVHTEGGLPLVDSGCVMGVDESGELEWKTSKAVKHEGSFETSLNVRCDGFRVTFSGNVSRFGRADNLFGFDFWECLRRVNAVLDHYALPPFTAGKKIERITRGDVRYEWTGARVSRIDLTANYETGSVDNAHALMQYLGTQHAGRHEGRVLGQGETVAWGGRGGCRQYWKAYIKHLEMQRHAASDQRVIDHCAERGVVRFEGTVRTKALTDMGSAFLGDYESGWAMAQLIQLFEQQKQVLHRAERSTDDLDELPRHLRATARDYMAGMDCAARMSRASFYRHRADLLPYGIDIAVRNVRPFQPRVRVIELRPAEIPSWYQLAA
ncbi:phage/plasmid replication protein, II/X family [Hydrogenophaga pseudoflava]|uniref:Phage X family protein n=1 Tax=Hydrogenophaga pseudoflava TaxID=47421 RepID=A0A4P6X0E5_HYDPS|nr:phage/plasmid replication protein, II/X family [Hydrogenophaga pseudoflava]QBM27948.1 Phage X family protein [Hydrogenophaga pseudoflava]